ncbi:glycosyltransferase family 1 protein, partial [Candidatus Saccharibacteria bacterium]|nr:glycosyltransferase family 1 protein [Candidatus Saccharibacteria bacterium]
EVYGDAAEYFDPLDVDAMASSIENIISNEALRVALVKKGYLQVKKYSWKKMAKQTHEVYENTLRSINKSA